MKITEGPLTAISGWPRCMKVKRAYNSRNRHLPEWRFLPFMRIVTGESKDMERQCDRHRNTSLRRIPGSNRLTRAFQRLRVFGVPKNQIQFIIVCKICQSSTICKKKPPLCTVTVS